MATQGGWYLTLQVITKGNCQNLVVITTRGSSLDATHTWWAQDRTHGGILRQYVLLYRFLDLFKLVQPEGVCSKFERGGPLASTGPLEDC